MNKHYQYLEKELCWLAFNERVLQEVNDKSNPLLERVHFLGIYSSNLDEFYKVQVADLKRILLIQNEKGLPTNNIVQLLKKINTKVARMNVIFDDLYNELLLKMARNKIFLINERQLSSNQEKWLKRYYHKYLSKHIQPIILTQETDLSKLLKDDYTYLAVEIIKGTSIQYALVNIPTDKLSRFILLPTEPLKKYSSLILLDNIIRFSLKDIFRSCFDFSHVNAYAIKITRDAEYDIIQETESSILDMMSLSLKQRLSAEPVRFIYQQEIPNPLINLLIDKLKISSLDMVNSAGRYHNFHDFVNFPTLGRTNLVNNALSSLTYSRFSKTRNLFESIEQKDVLLYYPYYKFEHVLTLLQQAAFDPSVFAIKINIYRVAKDSQILNTMINAVANGKKVTVIVELQARFDEAANIRWAKKLTESGVKVIFSPLELKIHAKLFLIERKKDNKIISYAHIGTGNFNENTATLYTDFSLLTSNSLITEEVKRVFRFIENPYIPVTFKYLIVSPQNSRKRLNELIKREIAFAHQGKHAEIQLKINNLVDNELINQLYTASTAGVKIRLIVRGMCTLVPNVIGMSENISVISIIDRFLEHARVYVFENGGQKEVYISSADWMTRNIDYRIEVGVKILDTDLQKIILTILALQFSDNTKARIIDGELNNNYVKNHKSKVRSQIAIYHYLSQLEKNTGTDNNDK